MANHLGLTFYRVCIEKPTQLSKVQRSICCASDTQDSLDLLDGKPEIVSEFWFEFLSYSEELPSIQCDDAVGKSREYGATQMMHANLKNISRTA